MSFNCFATYEQGSSSEEEYEEIIGKRTLAAPVQVGSGECRSFCSCGKSLKRVAKLPGHAMLLKCQTSNICIRCDEEIYPGELHFMCSHCDHTKVCKDCGPGVYIGRSFDFFDKSTGLLEVTDIPSRVLHYRKAQQKRRGQTRSRSVALDFEESDVLAMKLAEQVVENARAMMHEVMQDPSDESDKDWGNEGTLSRLLGVKSTEACCEAIKLLVSAATKVFAQSSTLQEVKAPCKVFGDTHGQLRDVLLLFGCFGFPGTTECPSIVFNGDLVDRGSHQVELLCLAFALKLAMPHNVYINRGNHEDATMNIKYGFNKACHRAVGEAQGAEVFDLIGTAFTQLPLASVIEDKVFVVHGGIGDGKWALSDLAQVKRPLHHSDLQRDSNQWLWNLLWSDPIEDDEGASNSVFGVHQSPRGRLAVKFGWNVTQAFCAANGLDLIVRSHQAKKHGLGFDVMHNDSLIRVFSARDYEHHDNDCAVLSVTNSAEGSPEDGLLEIKPQVLSSISRR